MLYLKIINRVFLFIEILLSILFLIVWTLLYPLLRLRYQNTLLHKHLPSVVLFRLFLWASNVFEKNSFKK
jgi:hypothetical protein